ncbi:MAG: hypothetical protein GYB31_08745 [Bacteroidetes bacterium]|nr:hypothetical protein [Bacteroidota bacterium]
MTRVAYFILLVLFLVACGPKPQQTTDVAAPVDYSKGYALLDSAQSAQALTIDTTDGFFRLVNEVEMEIQMKENFSTSTDREEMLSAYREFLKTEASNFTEEEKLKVSAVMELAKKQCDALNPAIFPQGVALVKVKTGHYGPSVYYTRENCIMIPEDVLRNFNPDGFLSVMLHEIFHVYSRFNPEKREALYRLIGYRPLEKVEISSEWDDLLLFNPDGVSYHWGIDLNMDGETVTAVPLISANETEYKSSKRVFFAYLNFFLHEAKQQEDGTWLVGNPLGPQSIAALFEQITKNTEYIIHPDEVMADNFMYLTYPFEEGQAPEFDEAGNALLDKVEMILRAK